MRLGVSPLRTLSMLKFGTAAALCVVCAGGFFVPRALAATGRSLVDASRDVRVDYHLRAIMERADENAAQGLTAASMRAPRRVTRRPSRCRQTTRRRFPRARST